MDQLLNITKALSDENRVRALMCLREGPLCLGQITDVLGLAPSTVSQHMNILIRARLVQTWSEGRWHYYRLADDEVLPEVRDALSWVRRTLHQDQRIATDRTRRHEVIRTSNAPRPRRHNLGRIVRDMQSSDVDP